VQNIAAKRFQLRKENVRRPGVEFFTITWTWPNTDSGMKVPETRFPKPAPAFKKGIKHAAQGGESCIFPPLPQSETVRKAFFFKYLRTFFIPANKKWIHRLRALSSGKSPRF